MAAIFPLGQTLQPRRGAWSAGFAMTWVVVAVMLFCDRDVAPIFGHLSALRGRRPAVRRAVLAAVLVALVLPGAAAAHATLIVRLAGDAVAPGRRRPRPSCSASTRR